MPDAPSTPPRLIRVWDPGVRVFHWGLVVAVALAFLSSEEESALAVWHIPIGYVAAMLIAFRLVWGFVGGEHARFANFVRPSQLGAHIRHLLSGKVAATTGHNPLGALAVLALLGLTAATVWTGVTGGEDAHEAIAYGLFGLVALHIFAVLIMSYLARDNLVLAMITGKKRAHRHPDAQDAKPPARLAAPIAAIAIGAAAYGATRIDPQAFVPHAGGEAGEEGESGESERDDD